MSRHATAVIAAVASVARASSASRPVGARTSTRSPRSSASVTMFHQPFAEAPIHRDAGQHADELFQRCAELDARAEAQLADCALMAAAAILDGGDRLADLPIRFEVAQQDHR